MKIRLRQEADIKAFGKYVTDDDLIILPNYSVCKRHCVYKVIGLFFMLILFGCGLYFFPKLPNTIRIEPIERVYAIGDNSAKHYAVYVKPIFGKEYQTSLSRVDVAFGLNDQLDVRASLFGLYNDVIRVIPIAQDCISAEYTKKVYEGDTLDKSNVRTFIRFKDGYEMDKDYDFTLPEGKIMHEVQMCINVEQFNRVYVSIKPIMSTGLSAKYNAKLYQYEPFDASHLKWYLVFEDGYMRRLSNDEVTCDTSNVRVNSNKVVLHGVSEYQTTDVTLKPILVDDVSAEYADTGKIYVGDSVDLSKITVTCKWADGCIKQIDDFRIASTYFGKSGAVIETDYGTAVLNPDLISVKSVVSNDATLYKAGDIPKASEFTISFSDGSTRTVSTVDVSLIDAWYQPLYAGKNRLAIIYRGTTYDCVISASGALDGAFDDSDDIVMEQTPNDSSNTMDNTNQSQTIIDSGNTEDDNRSDKNDNNNDADDDIIIER